MHICTRVMALDLHGNFVSAQYLETYWHFFTIFYICIHIDKILFRIVTCHFLKFVPELYGPLCSQNFISAQFPENKLTDIHQNFIYAFILTRSRLEFLSFCLHICNNVMAFIDVRILFLLNVLRYFCLISLELGLFTAWKVLQLGYSQNIWQF